MGWEMNLPGNARRGVDVNVRKHPAGGLVVLVRIWPDVSGKLGWEAGHPVAVLEGGGDDAGKLMLHRDSAARGAHVRRLGAPGSGEAPGHLSVAVHWPAYTESFPPLPAAYEIADGEFAGALIMTMPAQPAPQPPSGGSAVRPPSSAAALTEVRAELSEDALEALAGMTAAAAADAVRTMPAKAPRAARQSAAGKPGHVRMIHQIETAQAAEEDAARDEAAGSPAPEMPAAADRDLSVVIARAGTAKGNSRLLLEALIQCREIGPEEFARALGPKARDTSSGSVTGTVYQARGLLRGTGWHIEALGAGRYRLTEGEDPAVLGKKRPRKTGPRPRVPENHTKPAPQAPPRARMKIAATPDGACSYMFVEDGAVQRCGAPARGTYCETHIAKTAPAGGHASTAGSAMVAGRRK